MCEVGRGIRNLYKMWTENHIYNKSFDQMCCANNNLSILHCCVATCFIFFIWISREMDTSHCYTVNFYYYYYWYQQFHVNEYWMESFFFSDLFGYTTYIGFYITWIIHLHAAVFFYIITIFSTLFHVGVCSYIYAMVNDLKTIITTDTDTKLYRQVKRCRFLLTKTKFGLSYVDAIDFHYNILE